MSSSGPQISLDRMLIDDVGANPEKLVQAIHQQLNLTSGSVPVRDIALALDIEEITEAPLTSFEGALLTTPERASGKILLNSSSPPERRRFTMSHELGHFLNMTHQGESDGGFQCSQADMVTPKGHARHVRQEAEANRFAIELLAPPHLIRPYLIRSPDLDHVLAMAAALEISKEAAARRYVEKHRESLAVVLSKDGRVLYSARGPSFPFIGLSRSSALPVHFEGLPAGNLSALDEVDSADWLARPDTHKLWAQSLRQVRGYAMTLLIAEEPEDDEGLRPVDDFRG